MLCWPTVPEEGPTMEGQLERQAADAGSRERTGKAYLP